MQKTFDNPKPTLYIVSTPIGHLKDISFRAVEVLKAVHTIYAEDTRTSGVLLKAYKIDTQMISYHEHNKHERSAHIISTLASGHDIALISDAGTPGISDPGYEMIDLVLSHGFHVTTVPGASAMLSGLMLSGLPTDQFTFIGFLPKKVSELKQKLDEIKSYEHTLIIYESPKRISKCLEHLYHALGDRRVVLARELTKLYESILRTTLKEAISLEHDERGEYVIILEGAQKVTYDNLSIYELILKFIAEGYDEKTAMKLCAKHKGISKSDVYKVFKVDQQKT